MNTIIGIVGSSADSKNIKYNELQEGCEIHEEKVLSSAKSAPAPFASAFSALCQNLSELLVVFLFLRVVDTDMPGSIVSILYRSLMPAM